MPELTPDQEAVLSLVLKRRRSYDAVAGMLAIDTEAVRGRAQRALTALAGDPPAALDPGDAARIGDYLLGQLPEGDRIELLSVMLDSAPAREWGNRLSEVLAPRAADPLPQIPEGDDADAAPAPPARRERRPRPAAEPRPARRERPQPRRRPEPEPEAEADEDDEPQPAARRERPPRRRRPEPAPEPEGFDDDELDEAPPAADAGYDGDDDEVIDYPDRRGIAVVGLTAVLVIAAIVVFVVQPGGGSKSPPPGPISQAASNASTQTSSSSTGTGTGTTASDVVAQLTLTAGSSSASKATGKVAVINSGSGQELAFEASGLPAAGSSTYVLWLYNASKNTVVALGKLPAPSSSGAISPVQVTLPSSASSYTGVIVSLETSSSPAKPSNIVLHGAGSSAL